MGVDRQYSTMIDFAFEPIPMPDKEFLEFQEFMQQQAQDLVNQLNIPYNVLCDEDVNYNFESARLDYEHWKKMIGSN